MSNGYESFDDFDSTEQLGNYTSQKPFQFRDDKSSDGTLDWLNENFDMLERMSHSRLYSYRRWAALYKGIHWRRQRTRNYSLDTNINTKKPRVTDNFIMELVDARVAQMNRFGTNFSAIPWNNEVSDEITAKACQKLLKGRADELDLEGIHTEGDLIKYKYGTSFLFVDWDKGIGQDKKGMDRLKEIYPKGIPSHILKKIDGSTKIGDVNVSAIPPYKVFPEFGKKVWEKKSLQQPVNHVDIVEWIHIEELKARFPNKDIQPNKRMYYDYDSFEISMPEDMVMVRHFYHPPTDFQKGEYIYYCDSAILERTAYPYNHGKLPFIVDRDISIEDELWGRPRITQIEQMQRGYNNVESSNIRDLGLGSAPKWMAPKGSVDFRDLNNEFTVVEYKGLQAPQLVKNNPISKDSLVLQDRWAKRMGKKMKVFEISQGEVPTGITANSALRFLDEQESQLLAPDEKARKRRVLDTYRLMINVMQQYYKGDDDRTQRYLGKNNQYMIETMEKADFTKVYDVQFQNTSALPDTKTGKIAAIIDLNAMTQTDPIFRREDVVNMLDLGTEESFTEEATFSLDTAKMIFDQLLQGNEVPDPELHDDLMVYYTTMFRAIQSFQFKTKVPVETRDAVYEYIKTLEGLIFIKMMKNPKLAMEVQTLSYYPAFFELPVMPTPSVEEETEQAKLEMNKMENTNQNIKSARENEQANQA